MTSVFVSAKASRARRGARVRRLLASAALFPLLQGAALAETVISTATTEPVATSSVAGGAPDDITLTSEGSIAMSAVGAGVTLDSNNAVVNGGSISFNNIGDSAGVLVLGGRTGSVQNSGLISLIEDYDASDTDGDGDLDGPLAIGGGRHGVRVTGPQPFTGSIINAAGGQITIEGVDSAGISVETRLGGHLVQGGGISIIGDRSVGLRAIEVAGDVRVTGSIAAIGEGASAVSLGEVGGIVVLQNGLTATGYRSASRLADEARAKLDADDLLQGRPAVRIGGNVWGGVLLDAAETTAVLSSYGAAPGLEIGGAGQVTLGRVGTGEDAFGLVIKGQVYGLGINDGVAATALRVGVAGGGRTLLEGGLNLRGGAVVAEAYGADATAIQIHSGAEVAEIRNSLGASIAARSTTGGAQVATGVLIEAGATPGILLNAGTITADVIGAAGGAFAIADRSGGLSFVDNTGVIAAAVTPGEGETLTGQVVAIDLRANTSGAVVRQRLAGEGAVAPRIQGDILLGAGDDRLEVLAGALSGNLEFGAGADTLLIDGGALMSGTVHDADGRLAIDVRSGTLTLNQVGPTAITSLNLGSQGALNITIDPLNGHATRLDASGLVSIEAGAKVGVNLTSLLTEPWSYEIIRAGALRMDGASASLVGAPFLYNATLRADGNRLYADLRQRTATELGLTRSGGQAYEAVFGALGRNAALSAAFLAKLDQSGFNALYDQMLPDHSGAALRSAEAISTALSFATAQPRPVGAEPGQAAFWAQEIFFDIKQDRRDASGFQSRALGLAAGLEQTTTGGGAYGLAIGLVSTEYADAGAAVDERVVMNFAGGSLYARQELGGWVADVRAGGGLVAFDSDRRIVSADDALDLTARSDWLGWLVEAHAGLAYRLNLGRLFLLPRAAVDYVRLHQKGYKESGGGAGVDLEIDSRNGSRLTGTGTITLGMEMGDSFRWGPTLTYGRRELISGKAGVTAGRFLDGGAGFALDPETADKSTTIMRAGFQGSALGARISVDGGLEEAGPYRQWDVRAVAKFAF